ncbi:MAG: hypothetical protein L3J05_06955 [Robiginitomaculum sp.]|nr:hypothetical protein [Robiginitomaculum sp.]
MKRGFSKFGAGIACTVMALGFAGVAQADFVKTVNTEAQCTAQEGTVMDLNGVKHCLVPVISEEFQSMEYAGDLRGVTACDKANTRKTTIGDFCLIALEKKPVTTTQSITNSLTDMAKDEAEKAVKKEAKKKIVNALGK